MPEDIFSTTTPTEQGTLFSRKRQATPGEPYLVRQVSIFRRGFSIGLDWIPALALVQVHRFGPWLALLVLLANNVFLQANWGGRSVGKRLMHLKLAYCPGGLHQLELPLLKCSEERCFVRLVAHLLDFPFSIITVGLACFSSYGRSIADRLCSTIVIHDDGQELGDPEAYRASRR